MAKEFTLYGQTITISDDYDTFIGFYKSFVGEVKRAISEFTRACNNYGNIEKLLEKSKSDGETIILSVIQRAIISEVFVKAKIYDVDAQRFRQEFFKGSWGDTLLQQLTDNYNRLSREIDVWIANEKENRDEALGDTIGGLIVIGSPTPRGIHAEDRANKAEKKAKQLKKERDGLYQFKTELINEFSDFINGLWESCRNVMCEYGLANTSSILMLDAKNVKKANSIVNNMAHMSQDDVLNILPDFILSNPFNPELYAALFSCLGDPNGELLQIASYFGAAKDLQAAKDNILGGLFEKVKPDFYKTKERSALARKTFIERSQFYGHSREEAVKMLDDLVEQAKKEVGQGPDTFAGNASIVFGIVGTLLVFGAFFAFNVSGVLSFVVGLLALFCFNGAINAHNESETRNKEIVQKSSDARQLLDNWEDDYSSREASPARALTAPAEKSSKIHTDAQSAHRQEVTDIKVTDEESSAGLFSNSIPERLRRNLEQRLIALLKLRLMENQRLSQQPVRQTNIQGNYEPILGITTDALIKRAFLFLEDEQFDDAGRYFNQALNQDPEDSRIHLGLLILTCGFHNVEELINQFPKPLDEDKIFQRALRFAKDDEKAKLKEYARFNRAKIEEKYSQDQAEQERLYAELERSHVEAEAIIEQERIAAEARAEQQRLAEEAEKERILAEKEAEKEQRYQEILTMKEKAATLEDFNDLINRLNAIRGYKNTEQLYSEAKKSLKTETEYQDALREKQTAVSLWSLQSLVKRLEPLNGYKDAEQLLQEARESLKTAEEREKAKKRHIRMAILGVATLSVLAVGGFWFKDRSARIARENAMIAFFEGKETEAVKAIEGLKGFEDDPALLTMLAHINYGKASGDYERLKGQAENLRRNSTHSYAEAAALASRYDHYPSARKFLGDVYLFGWGVGKDLQKAADFYRIPAEEGDVYSQTAMADIYGSLLKDNAKAAEWYQKLAEQGSVAAQTKLGNMF